MKHLHIYGVRPRKIIAASIWCPANKKVLWISGVSVETQFNSESLERGEVVGTVSDCLIKRNSIVLPRFSELERAASI